MIPLIEISGNALDAVFLYTAILGLLLLAATILRVRLLILKRLFIPASLIAGVLGMFLGPHALGIFPTELTDYWSALSGRLIVIVFAPMMITGALPQFKKLANVAGPQIIFSYVCTFIQYAFPLLLGVFLLAPLFGVNDLFGTIVEQGWAGGHGTSGGMTMVFEELGYADGPSLSITSATVGLIFGIVGGTALINVGVRRGWTKVLTANKERQECSDLYTEPKDQQAGSTVTISPDVIESFAFHGALISAAVFLGWILNRLLKQYLHFSVSWFVTAMIGGLIVQLVIRKTKWNACIDRETMSRIQGVSLEFLVAGAVASVNIPVVLEYARPLLIQQGMMMVIMVLLVIVLAPRIFPADWFENAMVLFGTFCGVAATGLLLLRTCDPEMKTNASEGFAARTPFCSPLIGGGILTSITPGLVADYGGLTVGGFYLAGLLILLLLLRLFGWWHPPGRMRPIS